jgi:hypothetical protein
MSRSSRLLSPAARAAVRQLAPIATTSAIAPSSGQAPKYTSGDVPSGALPGVQTAVQQQTEIYTYFTRAGETKLLYSGVKWVQMKLTLETAGPVAVSNKAQVTPVLAGKGILLPTGEEVKFIVGKGTRIYIAAESINRVKVIIEPIPFLEEILMALGSMVPQ